MFRYHIELMSFEWVHPTLEKKPPICIELKFQKRGARSRVESFPHQFTIRSAPETENIILSLFQEGNIIASSDIITIGGMSRRVGVCTIALKSLNIIICNVRFLWSVEEEDGSVFSRLVEDFDSNEVQEKISSQKMFNNNSGENTNSHFDTTTRAPGNNSLSLTLNPSQVRDVLNNSEVLGEAREVERNHSQNITSSSNNTNIMNHSERNLDNKEKDNTWLLHSTQYAPKNLIDYYVTSTQVIGRPKAWCNLYTSPAPFLISEGLISEEKHSTTNNEVITKERTWDFLRVSAQNGNSAIEDILQRPTKAPERSEDDLQHALYLKHKNVKWRTRVSLNSTPTPPTARTL